MKEKKKEHLINGKPLPSEDEKIRHTEKTVLEIFELGALIAKMRVSVKNNEKR